MMTTNCDPEKNLDFKYFINLALMNKLPWDSLLFVLKDLATTLEKSNEVIEVLVQELQKLQIDLQNSSNQTENFAKETDNAELIDDQIMLKKVDAESENDCDSELNKKMASNLTIQEIQKMLKVAKKM